MSKAGTIGKSNGKTVANEVAVKPVGYVEVEYLVKHGTSKKGDKKEMHITTADALKAHKLVKISK